MMITLQPCQQTLSRMFSDVAGGKFYNTSAIILTSVHVTFIRLPTRSIHCMGNDLETEKSLSAFRHKVAQNCASGDVDGVRRLPRRWLRTTGTTLKVVKVYARVYCIFTLYATANKETIVYKTCGSLASYQWLLYIYPTRW
jgi:hypothetical protein